GTGLRDHPRRPGARSAVDGGCPANFISAGAVNSNQDDTKRAADLRLNDRANVLRQRRRSRMSCRLRHETTFEECRHVIFALLLNVTAKLTQHLDDDLFLSVPLWLSSRHPAPP